MAQREIESRLPHAISVDVEDWYHCLDPEPGRWRGYEDRVEIGVERLLEVFADTDTTATFFVLGDVAARAPQVVRRIHAAGHEVASHGSEHRFVYAQTPEAFVDDVQRCLDLLTQCTGAPVRGYRAPYFSITRRSLWALPLLRQLGLTYDASIHPVINHRYGIPGAPRLPHRVEGALVEIPVTTFPLGRFNVPCAGGVYFRVLPFALTRRLYARVQRRGEPLVFYVHPWELDPAHPRLPVGWALRARHYHRLADTEPRLLRLCRQFRFGSMAGLAAAVPA